MPKLQSKCKSGVGIQYTVYTECQKQFLRSRKLIFATGIIIVLQIIIVIFSFEFVNVRCSVL